MRDNLEIWRSKQLAVLMYKTINKSTPKYLTKIFENINSEHSHNVRNSYVYVPRPYTESGENSFHYQGAVLWNSLPRDVKSPPNLRSFKDFLYR